MREMLDEKLSRYEELERQMEDPEIVIDSARVAAIAREQGGLAKLALKYRQFKNVVQELSDIKEMLESDDPEERELAEMEIDDARAKQESGWDSRLLAISVSMDVDLAFAAVRSQNGSFSPHEIWTPLDIKTIRIAGPIENSLFLAAERGGVPSNTIMELIRIYSWDVDFQRDIQKGDGFEVFFEMLRYFCVWGIEQFKMTK